MFDECSIPGAKNVSFLDVIDDKKRVKAKEDLASLFQQAGVDLQVMSLICIPLCILPCIHVLPYSSD